MTRYYHAVLLAGVSLWLLSMAGCNQSAIQSIWRQQVIQNITSPFDDSRPMIYLEDQKVSLGFQNDADSLYIILKTGDRATLANVMRSGLTIWIDSKGKKNKTFGIHYPLGMQAVAMPPRDEQSPEEMPPGEETENIPRRHFAGARDTLEIFGPAENERHKISRENDLGISAVICDSMDMIAYELTIPLRKTDTAPYAIGAVPGSSISIGFETGKFERPRMNRPTGEGGGRGGGFPGGGGGFPGGGRGGFPGGRGRMSQDGKGAMNSGPLKYWTKVILAKPGAVEE